MNGERPSRDSAFRAKRVLLAVGVATLVGAWIAAFAGHGMTWHMIAHMASVAVAAPLLAYGVSGGAADPALRWPRIIAPMPISVVELVVVWGWHTPAARALAASSGAGLAAEQVSFAAVGVALWCACYGTRDAATSTRRGIAVIALLWTTMHMTLLGALITLAPRPLYPSHAGATPFGLTPLADQQVGGVVMLLVGGGAYLAGGLVLLAGLLRERDATGGVWAEDGGHIDAGEHVEGGGRAEAAARVGASAREEAGWP